MKFLRRKSDKSPPPVVQRVAESPPMLNELPPPPPLYAKFATTASFDSLQNSILPTPPPTSGGPPTSLSRASFASSGSGNNNDRPSVSGPIPLKARELTPANRADPKIRPSVRQVLTSEQQPPNPSEQPAAARPHQPTKANTSKSGSGFAGAGSYANGYAPRKDEQLTVPRKPTNLSSQSDLVPDRSSVFTNISRTSSHQDQSLRHSEVLSNANQSRIGKAKPEVPPPPTQPIAPHRNSSANGSLEAKEPNPISAPPPEKMETPQTPKPHPLAAPFRRAVRDNNGPPISGNNNRLQKRNSHGSVASNNSTPVTSPATETPPPNMLVNPPRRRESLQFNGTSPPLPSIPPASSNQITDGTSPPLPPIPPATPSPQVAPGLPTKAAGEKSKMSSTAPSSLPPSVNGGSRMPINQSSTKADPIPAQAELSPISAEPQTSKRSQLPKANSFYGAWGAPSPVSPPPAPSPITRKPVPQDISTQPPALPSKSANSVVNPRPGPRPDRSPAPLKHIPLPDEPLVAQSRPHDETHSPELPRNNSSRIPGTTNEGLNNYDGLTAARQNSSESMPDSTRTAPFSSTPKRKSVASLAQTFGGGIKKSENDQYPGQNNTETGTPSEPLSPIQAWVKNLDTTKPEDPEEITSVKSLKHTSSRKSSIVESVQGGRSTNPAEVPLPPSYANSRKTTSVVDPHDHALIQRETPPPVPPIPDGYPRRWHHGMIPTKEEIEAARAAGISLIYPLEKHIAVPELFRGVLEYLSFHEFAALSSVSRGIRAMLEDRKELRESVLERYLCTVGYVRWEFEHAKEPLKLSLKDLNSYLRGVSIPIHRYSEIAEAQVPREDGSKSRIVRLLASSTRAYSRIVLRLRAQAEAEAYEAQTYEAASPEPRGGPRPVSPLVRAQEPPRSWKAIFQSPLFRIGHAPLLRVFVPSPEGPWLSDKSIMACEKELKRAGLVPLLKPGDVIWDTAVSDEANFGNVGRLIWDGNYLIDLDYTFSNTGDVPPYLHSLSFPPSYFHKVLRTSGNPVVQLDLRPWGREIAMNLQLIQDKYHAENQKGNRHMLVRWTHRSRFIVQRNTPIPDTNLTVDPSWEGVVILECEGTNEGLADLQLRCGVEHFKPQQGVQPRPTDGGRAFKIIRERSRPGELWIRALRQK